MSSIAPFPRGQRLASLVLAFVLFLPWLLNPAWGPSPIILQTALSAAAALAWFVVPPAERGDAAGAIALSWLVGASANAAIALVQYTGVIHESTLWYSAASYGEAYGNLRQRNQLATLLALGLASAFYFAALARSGWLRLLLALSVVTMSAACALTTSRTGLLQWLILGGLALVAPWLGADRRWRLWGLLALGSYFLAMFTLPALAQGWTGQAPTTLLDRVSSGQGCVSRKVLWRNALDLIAQRPWTGWGLGEMDYAHHVTLYPGERFCLIVDNAHNLFLQVAVELGLPMALLLAACIALGLWKGRPWAERRAGRLLAWAALGAVMLHSQFEYPLWYGPFELAALLSLSLLAMSPAPGDAVGAALAATGPRARLGEVRNSFRLAMGALVLAVIGYVLWDYYRISQLFLPESARAPAYHGATADKVKDSWLFSSQVSFAIFTTSPLTPANAAAMAELGEAVMHYSPEPQVAQKLVEALRLAGREDRAQWHEIRYRVAFPDDYAAWVRESASAAAAASAPASR